MAIEKTRQYVARLISSGSIILQIIFPLSLSLFILFWMKLFLPCCFFPFFTHSVTCFEWPLEIENSIVPNARYSSRVRANWLPRTEIFSNFRQFDTLIYIWRVRLPEESFRYVGNLWVTVTRDRWRFRGVKILVTSFSHSVHLPTLRPLVTFM